MSRTIKKGVINKRHTRNKRGGSNADGVSRDLSKQILRAIWSGSPSVTDIKLYAKYIPQSSFEKLQEILSMEHTTKRTDLLIEELEKHNIDKINKVLTRDIRRYTMGMKKSKTILKKRKSRKGDAASIASGSGTTYSSYSRIKNSRINR
jgi:hypothetical protein